MRCAICGNEFGNGSNCQNCGADRVSALGNYSGYSAPKSENNLQGVQIGNNSNCVSNTICWKCGEVIPGNSKFCPICGTKLLVQCSHCGKSFSANFRFCPDCGAQLPRGESTNSADNLSQKVDKLEKRESSIANKESRLYKKELELRKWEEELKHREAETANSVTRDAKNYALGFYASYYANPFLRNKRIEEYFNQFNWGSSEVAYFAKQIVKYTLMHHTHSDSSDRSKLSSAINDAVAHLKI